MSKSARKLTIRNSVAIEPRQVYPRSRVHGHLIFAGRLLEWKGAAIAIESLKYLNSDFTLSIYGKGPDEARLRSIAQRSGVVDRVFFKGHIPRDSLQKELAKAQALLFPSIHDSGGWAVAESIEAGCPVICLDLGGPAEIVGDNGTIVNHRSPDLPKAFAEAVEILPHSVSKGQWTNDRLPGEIDKWYSQLVPRRTGT